MMVKREILTVV